jgi:hypothetical protein
MPGLSMPSSFVRRISSESLMRRGRNRPAKTHRPATDPGRPRAPPDDRRLSTATDDRDHCPPPDERLEPRTSMYSAGQE